MYLNGDELWVLEILVGNLSEKKDGVGNLSLVSPKLLTETKNFSFYT